MQVGTHSTVVYFSYEMRHSTCIAEIIQGAQSLYFSVLEVQSGLQYYRAPEEDHLTASEIQKSPW